MHRLIVHSSGWKKKKEREGKYITVKRNFLISSKCRLREHFYILLVRVEPFRGKRRLRKTSSYDSV